MKAETHKYWELAYVLHGRGFFDNAGERFYLQRGDLVLIPNLVSHSFEDTPEQPLSLLIVCIEPKVLRAMPNAITDSKKVKFFRDEALTARCHHIFRELLFEQHFTKSFGSTLMISLAWELLAKILRTCEVSQKKPEPKLQGVDFRLSVQNYLKNLECSFFETEDINDIAQRLGMSRRSFTSYFRQTTGSSWLSYIRKLRIQHAKKLLAQTDHTVISIAFECGFNDLSSFYRAFHLHERTSPDAWRKTTHNQ